jgi:AcrR family transcriptional regulator
MDIIARIFAQQGYRGTGTRQLAEALGIKTGSLYMYVSSKEAALEEICMLGLVASQRAFRKAVAQPGGVPERLRFYFRLQCESLVETCNILTGLLNDRRFLENEARARIDAIGKSHIIEIEKFCQQGLDQGEIHPALNARNARLLLVGTSRLINKYYLDGPIRDFDRLADSATEFFLRGILPPRADSG